MALDKSLVEKFRLVTTKAAYAASKFRGLNDKIGADKAAVDVMRTELNKINMLGRVVIGEGELDEAPMLYIGEELGSGKGQEIDIAVDLKGHTKQNRLDILKNRPCPIQISYLGYPGTLGTDFIGVFNSFLPVSKILSSCPHAIIRPIKRSTSDYEFFRENGTGR